MEESKESDPAQERRFIRAQGEECTPDSVDLNTYEAIFPAQYGAVYNTSLTYCSCPDFANNDGLPCKHIYRLGMETGLLKYHFEKGVNKNRQIFKRNAQMEHSWNGFCITSFLLSIIGFIFCWLIFPGILSLLGVIFGTIGLIQSNKVKSKGKALAIWGISLSGVGLFVSLGLFFIVLLASILGK